VTRISDEIARQNAAHRSFDWKGNMDSEAINVSNLKKVADFRLNFDKEKEFLAYLRSHQLEELIPTITLEEMLKAGKEMEAEKRAAGSIRKGKPSMKKKSKSSKSRAR
jgi:hypothetical protein